MGQHTAVEAWVFFSSRKEVSVRQASLVEQLLRQGINEVLDSTPHKMICCLYSDRQDLRQVENQGNGHTVLT